MSLNRRGPLQRKTPLVADAAKTRAWQDRSRRANRIRPTKPSPAEIEERRQVREEVFRRDGYRCLLKDVPGAGPCAFGLTYHHRRKSGQGGPWTVENGATLCGLHNTQLEADADLVELGRSLGLVLRRGDT